MLPLSRQAAQEEKLTSVLLVSKTGELRRSFGHFGAVLPKGCPAQWLCLRERTTCTGPNPRTEWSCEWARTFRRLLPRPVQCHSQVSYVQKERSDIPRRRRFRKFRVAMNVRDVFLSCHSFSTADSQDLCRDIQVKRPGPAMSLFTRMIAWRSLMASLQMEMPRAW